MSEEYKIEDQYILNIKSETTKFEFDEKLKLNIGYKIKRNEKILTNDEIIATGDILETEEGKQYLLIVLGDITKNGKIQIYDLNKLRVCILKNEFDLDEQQKLAADCNLDGRDLNVRDLVRLRILLLTKTT